jgi:uncharacterized membrane protein
MLPDKDAQRMDALTDGVFAIVATLLVLEIKLPDLKGHSSASEVGQSLLHVLPSFLAFAFSFLTVAIYWLNHDYLSSLITRYTPPLKYLNLLLLFWICLIPFPTKFISEYPTLRIASVVYGTEMMMVAISGTMVYRYLAFHSGQLHPSISTATRKNVLRKYLGGPVLYGLSVILALVHPYLAIGMFILIPLLFVILPKVRLE